MHCHAATRQVHVCPFRVLRREHPADHVDLVADSLHVLADGAGEVIAVRDRDLAFAGHDAAQLVGIAALRRARHVRHHPLGPGAGGLGAVILDDRGQQRLVVGVVRRPDADQSLVPGIGQVEIGARRVADLGLVIEDDPRPLREAEPFVVGILQVAGDAGFQKVAVDGLQHAGLLGPLQPRGVHREQDIGGGIASLGLHPRDQLVGLALDPVHGDAGGVFEIGIKPLVGVVVTGRVNVDLALGQRCHGGKRRHQRNGAISQNLSHLGSLVVSGCGAECPTDLIRYLIPSGVQTKTESFGRKWGRTLLDRQRKNRAPRGAVFCLPTCGRFSPGGL